ncbi:MAG: hypothetical protein FJW27_03185 [Acidimicrobiia bacterium]|nr:hypothetical protein [Acidimicrobiia bacterium]
MAQDGVRGAQPRARAAWWTLLITTLAIVLVWPPQSGKSLALTFVNWAVDPSNQLPTLPPQLGMGLGDDPLLVEARDAEVRRYDDAFNAGGWTRRRLLLKVAGDPFDPATTRQVLLVVAVLVWFVVWRIAASPSPTR